MDNYKWISEIYTYTRRVLLCKTMFKLGSNGEGCIKNCMAQVCITSDRVTI